MSTTDKNDVPSFHIELESQKQNQFRVRLIEAPDNGRKSRSILSTSPFTQTYKGRPYELAKELGQALYRSIFVEEIGERFEECRRRLCSKHNDNHVRLRLILDVQTPPPYTDPLFDWPWELLHDGKEWLALDPTLSITRRLNTLWVRPDERGTRLPMRVLLAYAEPTDKGSVRGEEILDTISGVLRAGVKPLDLVSLSHVTARTLGAEVKKGVHIIHFLGHGALETEKAVMAMVFLELPEGRASDVVTASEFKRWIEDAEFRPRLIVLTACHSSSAGASANLGLAQALLGAGVEAVVGMQTELWTDEAKEFVRAFYEVLAKRSRIDDAMQAGRQALELYWRDRPLETDIARVLVASERKQHDSPTTQYHLTPAGEDVTKNVFSFPGWAVPTLFLQGDGWLGQGPPESPILWERDQKEMVYVEEGSFYIDKYPVTCGEYRKFVQKYGVSWQNPWQDKYEGEDVNVDALPATGMTLGEALEYARWARKHIPTPAEWQQAALSGYSDKQAPFPWGHRFLGNLCNTQESGYLRPRPVKWSSAQRAYDEQGEMISNSSPAGMCDIVGNVAEWTQTEDRQSVLCGGAFNDPSDYCTVQRLRLISLPDFKNHAVGFRCAASWSEVIEHQHQSVE